MELQACSAPPCRWNTGSNCTYARHHSSSPPVPFHHPSNPPTPHPCLTQNSPKAALPPSRKLPTPPAAYCLLGTYLCSAPQIRSQPSSPSLNASPPIAFTTFCAASHSSSSVVLPYNIIYSIAPLKLRTFLPKWSPPRLPPWTLSAQLPTPPRSHCHHVYLAPATLTPSFPLLEPLTSCCLDRLLRSFPLLQRHTAVILAVIIVPPTTPAATATPTAPSKRCEERTKRGAVQLVDVALLAATTAAPAASKRCQSGAGIETQRRHQAAALHSALRNAVPPGQPF